MPSKRSITAVEAVLATCLRTGAEQGALTWDGPELLFTLHMAALGDDDKDEPDTIVLQEIGEFRATAVNYPVNELLAALTDAMQDPSHHLAEEAARRADQCPIGVAVIFESSWLSKVDDDTGPRDEVRNMMAMDFLGNLYIAMHFRATDKIETDDLRLSESSTIRTPELLNLAAHLRDLCLVIAKLLPADCQDAREDAIPALEKWGTTNVDQVR